MVLGSLRGLLPDLSGLIGEHAALMVNNPTLPLSEMPFARFEINTGHVGRLLSDGMARMHAPISPTARG